MVSKISKDHPYYPFVPPPIVSISLTPIEDDEFDLKIVFDMAGLDSEPALSQQFFRITRYELEALQKLLNQQLDKLNNP